MANFDIDPTDIEFDIENSQHNNTRGATYHLSRIQDTRIWVHYTTYKTPDGLGYNIRDMGYLSYDVPDLSTDRMADQIQSELDDAPALDKDVATALRDRADEIADDLNDEWHDAVEEVMSDVSHEGVLHVDSGVISASDIEPYAYELQWAIPDDIRDADDTGVAYGIVREAYQDAAKSAKPNNAGAHDEYGAYIDLDDVDDDNAWQLRAVELEQHSVLPRQTARVQALREQGMQQREIADMLGIDKSTVSRHVSRADDHIKRAEWTVENVA